MPPATETANAEDSRPRQGGMRRGLVEAEILAASAELFANRGFAATSLQDIADALGISRPALYHYFGSKDDILARLTDGLLDSTERVIESAADHAASADQRLHALIKGLTEPIAEYPGRFRLLLTRDASVSPAGQERLRQLERKVFRSVSELIADGVKEGHFRRCDQRTATFAILGMINWVAWWYAPARALNIEELSCSIADFAVAGLRSDKKRAEGGSVGEVIASIQRDLKHLSVLTEEP